MIKVTKITTGVVSDILNKSTTRKYLKLILSGILIAVASKFFIIYANIFSPGLGGIAQGISYTLYDTIGHSLQGPLGNAEIWNNTMYWIIYGSMNIPVIWFTYVKFGKRFLGESLVVMASSIAVTMLLTFTPQLNEAAFIPGWKADTATDFEQFTLAALAGVLGGMIYGFGVGMAFGEGVSSMGFDPIAKHLQRDKGMNIKTVMFTVAFINSVFWIIVSAGIDGELTTPAGFFNTLISPRILGSVLFLGVYSSLMTSMSSHKPLKAEITTSKGTEISNSLTKGFERTHTITEVTGGYSKRKLKRIEVILYNVEIDDVLKLVSDEDENAFIVTSPISKIYANFDSAKTFQEKEIDKHRQKRKENREQLKVKKQILKEKYKNDVEKLTSEFQKGK